MENSVNLWARVNLEKRHVLRTQASFLLWIFFFGFCIKFAHFQLMIQKFDC